MKKIILVDEIKIGKFEFQAYILDRGENSKSFSIFIPEIEEPAIEMIADEYLRVSILFNPKLMDYVLSNKTESLSLRKKYCKDFIKFLLEAEKKASYMIFKKQKLNYMKSAKEVLGFRDRYLAN